MKDNLPQDIKSLLEQGILKEEDLQHTHLFSIEKPTQTLYYFGSNHHIFPGDEQTRQIKEFWQEFLRKTQKQNCLVLLEGGQRPVAPDENTAVGQHGEAGLITFLASKERIPFISPEPNDREEIEKLRKQFSKDQIIHYYIARLVPQWRRRAGDTKFEEYAKAFLDYYRMVAGWDDFEFTVEHIKQVHKSFFQKEFDESDTQLFKDIKDGRAYSVMGQAGDQIGNQSHQIRDIHIVGEIKKLWDEGKNIFIIFGGSHAVVQEPVLRTLLR